MASQLSQHPFDRLSHEMRSQTIALLIPKTLDFVEHTRAPNPTVVKNRLLPQLFHVPHHYHEEINSQLFSQPHFAFQTSKKDKNYVHGYELAVKFLQAIQPTNAGRIRNIHYDIQWASKAEPLDTIFRMLALLASKPSGDIDCIEFNFEPKPEAKHATTGVRTKSFGFALQGMIGIEVVFFVVGIKYEVDLSQCVGNMNEWIRPATIHHRG